MLALEACQVLWINRSIKTPQQNPPQKCKKRKAVAWLNLEIALVIKHSTNESCLKVSILQPAACSTNRADWCLLRGRAGGSLAGQGGVQWSANHATAVNRLKVKGSVLSERTDGGADSACRYCGENTNLLAVAGPLARRPSRQ